LILGLSERNVYQLQWQDVQMGKHRIKNEALAFIPKISKTSRKLASRRLESLDTHHTGGVPTPHFMLNTRTHTREPLAPIPTSQSVGPDENRSAQLTSNDSVNDFSIEQKASFQKEKLFKDKVDSKSNPETFRSNMSGKNDVNLDDNIFTFKPKVSSASAKIVENLGTDFMARQQQHIERQRRNVSFFEVMCCACKSRGPFALTTHLPWVRST
jgi:hypothetical protein